MEKEISNAVQVIKLIRSLNKEFDDAFEERFQLTRAKFEIRYYLYSKGSSRQSELAAALEVDKSAITRHLKTLEGDGVITRKVNEKNNREVIVELTTKGKNEIENCVAARENILSNIFINLSDYEIDELKILLEKISRTRTE